MQCIPKRNQRVSPIMQCTQDTPRTPSTHGCVSCDNNNQLSDCESFQASRHCNLLPRANPPCVVCIWQPGCWFKTLDSICWEATRHVDSSFYHHHVTIPSIHQIESLSYSNELWEKCWHNLSAHFQNIPSIMFDQFHSICPGVLPIHSN